MGLDDFLGHSTRGGGTKYLSGWKKRATPEVDVWLHTQAPIMAVYTHPWPKIVEREKDGKKTREVWSGSFVSWETEDLLKGQYKRDPNGYREEPPVICPMSIMLEFIRQAVDDNKIPWTEPLFKFVGDDPTKAKVLHAGVMYNGAKRIWEDLSSHQQQAALAIGVPPPSKAWMGNMMAKCQYVFAIVDNSDLSAGCQVATETSLVGDKMKKCIRDAMTALGDSKGNPMLSPYAFRWQHRPREQQFQDKYNVIKMDQLQLTDEVARLIGLGEDAKAAPDIERQGERGDVQMLRASIEAHYIGPQGLLDFDVIFAAAEKEAGLEETGEEAGDVADDIIDAQPGEVVPSVMSVTSNNQTGGVTAGEIVQAPPAAAPAEPVPTVDPYACTKTTGTGDDEKYFAHDGVELFACDECEKIVRDNEPTCRHCGFAFEVPEAVAAPEPPPPAPKPRGRGRATTKAAAPAAPTASAAKSKATLGF